MDLGSLEGKAQELAFIGSDHPALGRVDRQFQAVPCSAPSIPGVLDAS